MCQQLPCFLFCYQLHLSLLFPSFLGGFNTSKKIQVQKRRSQLAAVDIEPTNQLPDSPQKTTIAFALGSHHLFMTLTLFCQGLFAGIALWHIITIQYMVNMGYDNLLAQYSQLAKPLESMYYLLFALCTVASFDRYVSFFVCVYNVYLNILEYLSSVTHTVYIGVCTYACIQKYICIRLCVWACVHACMYVYTDICACICIIIYLFEKNIISCIWDKKITVFFVSQ